MKYEEAVNNIEFRAKIRKSLIDISNETGYPELLEVENVTRSYNYLRYLTELYVEEHGDMDYNEIYEKWINWVKDYIKYVSKYV